MAVSPDLASVCSRLKLQEKDVINAYLLGSRLWGTFGPDSDYDFLVVLDDKASTLSNAPKGFLNIHSGNFDAMVLSMTLFKEKLQDYSSTYELLGTWVPAEFVLRERFDAKSYFKLDHRRLEVIVKKTVDRDWSEGQKYIEKGHVDRGKKTLIHMFRVILLFTQVAELGRVQDYAAPGEHEVIATIRSMYARDWETYSQVSSTYKSDLMDQLHNLCTRS